MPRAGGNAGGVPAPEAARAAPLVQITDLWHTYMSGTPFEHTALRGVTLEVRPGEVVGIIGQTGSGKSTLTQCLNALIRPHRGRVVIGGHDLAHPGADVAAVRRLVGVVFQDPEEQLFERLVGDDVAYGPRMLGLPRGDIRERVRWAMNVVGLPFESFKDRYIFSLSGGEQRKAALAGVLALRPRLLVLDEPTAGLDPGSRDELWARIGELRSQEGLTLVLVSHDMDEIARLSDRLYVLHEGRVAASGTPRAVFSDRAALDELGLAPPAAAQIVHRLRERGYHVPEEALTIEEAARAIATLLEPPA